MKIKLYVVMLFLTVGTIGQVGVMPDDVRTPHGKKLGQLIN